MRELRVAKLPKLTVLLGVAYDGLTAAVFL